MKIRLLISSMVVAGVLIGVAHAGEHSVRGVETRGVETRGVETRGVETRGVETRGVETRGVEASAESGIMIALNETGAKGIVSGAKGEMAVKSIIRKNIRSDAQIIDS